MVGAGTRRLPGWVHADIDATLQPDLLMDICQPLQLADHSVDVIFCEEVLTQIPLPACVEFLRECRRVLRSDGRVRVLMPDLRRFIDAYLHRPDWLREIWHRHVALPLHADTACEVFNAGFRGVGPFVYDQQTFAWAAAEAGMSLLEVTFNQSSHPDLAGIDLRSPEETLTAYYELQPDPS